MVFVVRQLSSISCKRAQAFKETSIKKGNQNLIESHLR
ncbi:hypothetical protein BALOs_0662 [Halobacteriovorax sp. BALOs_7]|nr:hypothetical protein BALOs_0662 [Halobacteriovorax sp. BALOs_7]